jgi:IMP dehydrogenase
MVVISPVTSRTFAEYRFIPKFTHAGLNKDSIDFSALLTKKAADKKQIKLNIPVLSAAMQSVTGPRMAIALAQQGGLGVLFCSQPIDEQALAVRRVKRARAGFVSILEFLNPDSTIRDAISLIQRTGYNTIPVVAGNAEEYGRLLGIIEGPISIETAEGLDEPVTSIMQHFHLQPLNKLVSETNGILETEELIRLINNYIPLGIAGISLEEANKIMFENRRKYIPIINRDGTLKFMVFKKDVQAHTAYPHACVDDNKRYVVGAAVNTHDFKQRVPALVEAGVDVLFIDSSDGFSEYQRECIQFIKLNFPSTPIIAGNIVSGEAFDFLAEEGVDGVKVGMGGGSICITQEQKGTGRGQATAVLEVVKRRDAHFKKTGEFIPVISDGGLVHAKDIAMALAFGADLVMMGRYFACCSESPTVIVERDGKKLKEYWGEGSLKAKAWVKKRYGQSDFDEGVVALVPYTGTVAENISQTFAKIAATMISIGANSIKELQEKAEVELISAASRTEGAVHDVEEISSRKNN